jgi:hypothetical protein
VSGAALDAVRDARLHFREWLNQSRQSPDPTSQPRGAMKALAESLKRVEVALREMPESPTESEEWKREIADYRDTLQELRARLGNSEITLRIRSAQMAKKQVQLDVVQCWADLAKHIG